LGLFLSGKPYKENAVKEKIKPAIGSVNHKLTKLFTEFFDSERSSGIVLILCTLVSIVIANSPLGKGFIDFWHIKLGFEAGGIALNQSLEHWINDGLMAIFFLLIGLEIEREIYIGELSNLKNASLPIMAALGGMVVPALLHFLLNRGTETQNGIGVPMATDIAFALGVLALLGNKAPVSLKIFLTALAIIDDLGAILIIALFYVSDFSFLYLVLALSVYGGLLVLNRLGVQGLPFYLIPGVVMWYFMLQSGVHATVAGVLLAFALPFGDGSEKSPSYKLQHFLHKPVPSYKLQHFLHKPVAFGVMPIFALANTGIAFSGKWFEGLTTSNSLGVLAGLFVGKPLGIFSASFIAVKMGLSRLSEDLSWKHIIGAGFLGGIGFTMSIFITLLAFSDPEIIQSTKIIILLSSLLAGVMGFLILNRQMPNDISSKS
jgi:Na+:H+ antiporter, NhaA family